ncbi:GntR family transcriptional regulator [Ectobacillus ponti]|uniref:GntR family transcriptional regulator n=1 Tax=Ectobacillus ponti TaxID=2961894 RepID=A0AA42BU23_9BACI|nr:GntR family transcriptional regulator [Ectobacillus ponti]MCP8970093.1 GntR family transcriptional regulator [Ectobacillus ponti]
MDLYEAIKNAIITGTFEPGKRLTEEMLASEFHVSRTPIREALKQLEHDGLVTALKKGVSVRSFTREDIQQIYNLRALLESYAASQAAVYRSVDDIASMRAANLRYKEALQKESSLDLHTIHEVMKINQLFHEAVITASQNEHLRFHISKVVMLPLMFHSFYWYDLGQIQASLQAHETMVTAIERQDAERAKIVMQEHVYQARDHVLDHLEEIQNRMEKREFV